MTQLKIHNDFRYYNIFLGEHGQKTYLARIVHSYRNEDDGEEKYILELNTRTTIAIPKKDIKKA